MKKTLLLFSGLIALLGTGSTLRGAQADPTQRPDDNRFNVVRVTPPDTLNEPMEFQLLKDGRAFIIERRGGIKVYDPATASVKNVGALWVNNAARVGNGEQGLVGMALDPKFTENGWMYLYYFHPTEEEGVISRWEIRDNVLVANSEKVMLEWPAQREACCHTGGGMTWDEDGNLFVTIGNNRGNNLASHTDERPGRAPWDDQGGTSNSNSLEGKILRIHPEPDGTYTIPEGNLFAVGTPKTRPEIYTMGHRNAWRVSRDSQTGFIYWGEVGPDARANTEKGPQGYDEFNQARHAGYFGWPYFIGDIPYPVWDYATDKPGAFKNPEHPTNTSPNNTGITELPPLEPSFIYYPYGLSDKYPELGTGGRSATGGPIYRQADFDNPKRPWPSYFEGKWLATDLSRRLIVSITMNENGDYQSMERIIPDYKPVEPIDMKFGPDGDLYVLEYGGRWFQASPEAKLTRIEYEGGNRKPIVIASADKTGGIPPFDVKLSSEGTQDFDHDSLKYQWDVIDVGGNARTFTDANPTVKLDGLGPYIARLTVTDPSGLSDSKSVTVVSGNEPPNVAVKIKGNETFYFPDQPFGYEVDVNDREDGSVSNGRIKPDQVALSIDYTSAGFDLSAFANLPSGDAVAAQFPVAQALMAKGNCQSCHLPNAKLVGPSFTQIAEKYRGNTEAPATLATKIVTGGAGSWGEVAMPPNSAITESDASAILKYVLSLGDDGSEKLPLAGDYVAKLPEGDDGTGSFIVRAVYTDLGEEIAPPLSAQGIKVLRSAKLGVADATENSGVEAGRFGATVKPGAYLAFNGIDMTGITQVDISASAFSFGRQKGGEVEVRLGSPTGKLIGSANVEVAEPAPRARPRPEPEIKDADAPTAAGTGKAPTPAPRRTRAPRLAPPPKQIPIVAMSGPQDLYLVFQNKDAEADDALMSFSGLEFKVN